MKRALLLIPILGCSLLAAGEPSIKFIHPKRAFMIAPPGGIEIPVQVWIEPKAENRAFIIVWEGGSSMRTLEGDTEAATQQQIKIRLYEGQQSLRAAVFGAGGKLLHEVEMPITVCGMQEECVK